MNAYDIDRLFGELAAFDLDALCKRVTRLNDRDRAGTTIPDGYGSRTLNTDIVASDPEALTPTERAADRRAFGRPERDLVHEANIHALSALNQALTALCGVLDSVKRGEELQRWERPIGHTVTPCKLDGCNDAAQMRGMCGTHYRRALRWEHEHNGEEIPLGELMRPIDKRGAA